MLRLLLWRRRLLLLLRLPLLLPGVSLLLDCEMHATFDSCSHTHVPK